MKTRVNPDGLRSRLPDAAQTAASPHGPTCGGPKPFQSRQQTGGREAQVRTCSLEARRGQRPRHMGRGHRTGASPAPTLRVHSPCGHQHRAHPFSPQTGPEATRTLELEVTYWNLFPLGTPASYYTPGQCRAPTGRPRFLGDLGLGRAGHLARQSLQNRTTALTGPLRRRPRHGCSGGSKR